MSGFQITCANKNPQGDIIRLGGPGWSLSIDEVITKLIGQQLRLNILIGNQHFAIGVRGEGSEAYLALEPDGSPLTEVEGLQSC